MSAGRFWQLLKGGEGSIDAPDGKNRRNVDFHEEKVDGEKIPWLMS
jgi:hypothetical protein